MVHPAYVKNESESTVQSIALACLRVLVFVLAVAAQGILFVVEARPLVQAPQTVTKTQTTPKPQPKKRYTLRITKGDVTGISLKAEKAKLSEIAADLAKRLGTRVILGPAMEKEAITVEFADLTLEPAMRLLAPRVYIDYEIRANAQPVPLGIFLLDNNDPDPATSAVVQASSQAMLIEGNTEDTGESSESDPNDPLQVELDDNYLTVKAKKQPLGLVVVEIADVLGVPADIKYDSDETVNTEIKGVPFEDAIPRLSLNIRLYVRADLNKARRTALRVSVVQPQTKAAGQ